MFPRSGRARGPGGCRFEVDFPPCLKTQKTVTAAANPVETEIEMADIRAGGRVTRGWPWEVRDALCRSCGNVYVRLALALASALHIKNSPSPWVAYPAGECSLDWTCSFGSRPDTSTMQTFTRPCTMQRAIWDQERTIRAILCFPGLLYVMCDSCGLTFCNDLYADVMLYVQRGSHPDVRTATRLDDFTLQRCN